MAVVSSSFSMNMLNLDIWSGFVSSSSSTEITYLSSGGRLTYNGSFSVVGKPNGTINGVDAFGDATFTITGLDKDFGFVQSLIDSRDTGGIPFYLLSGSDTVNGSFFDDLLIGFGGNDTINGNAGADFLWGMDGVDVLRGGTGDDIYLIDDPFDIAQENLSSGYDSIATDLSSYTLPDNFEELNAFDLLAGEEVRHNFTGRGNQLDNSLFGGLGNDTLYGLSGADYLDGGAGDDLLIGGFFADYSPITDGASTIFGGAGADKIFGGNDNDDLFGEDGNDEFYGGLGSDLIDGGAGYDLAVYRYELQSAPVNFDATNVSPSTSATLTDGSGTDILVGVEALSVAGGSGADIIRGALLLTNTLVGNAGSDQLYGGNAGDLLNGGDGNDLLDGGQGFDGVIYASSSSAVSVNLATGVSQGQGSDTLLSIEQVIGSNFGDTIIGSSAIDSLSGLGGADFLDGGSGADALTGGLGDDIYIVDNDGDAVAEFSAEGTDTVRTTLSTYGLGFNVENLQFAGQGLFVGRGNGLANRLTGGTATDVLAGLAGNDVLDGGAGQDVADYGASTSAVVATIRDGYAEDGFGSRDSFIGIEHLYGSAHADVLVGHAGFNVLAGQGGADQLHGLGGDDVIEGEAGADLIDGGEGRDRVTFEYGVAGVIVSLRDGYAEDGYGSRDRLVSIEDTVGSRFSDVLVGDAGGNEIRAGAGDDTLLGEGGSDVLDGGDGGDTISFGSSTAGIVVSLRDGYAEDGFGGRDLLSSIERVMGSAHADIIVGGTNADLLNGAAGADELYGLEGDDTLVGGAGNDRLDGGAGVDAADYRTATASITVSLRDGYAEDGLGGRDLLGSIERVVGSSQADFLLGSLQSDTLEGGAGADQLYGLEGDDVLTGGAGNDRLEGGTGVDTGVYNSGGASVVVSLRDGYAEDGVGGRDVVVGMENIVGSDFSDVLVGSADANRLIGWTGNDTLAGFGGDDFLDGGAGDDVFVFTTFTGAGTVAGFTAGAAGGDRIDISAHSTINDYAALMAAASNTTDGVLLDLGAGAIITILGTTKEQLTPADFVI